MKKVYTSPEISEVLFDTADIITASSVLESATHHAGSTSAKINESTWNEELSTGL